MGQYVEKINCPSCGSSDANAVYKTELGLYNSFCYSCGAFCNDPYNDNKVQEKQKEKEPLSNQLTQKEIEELPSLADLSRSISQEALQHYNIKTEVSQQDGFSVVAHYYPVTKQGRLSGYKKRTIPKTFTSIGDCKTPDLFGQAVVEKHRGKRLYITEGELDCASLFQALVEDSRGTEWAKYVPCVVSLPHGSQSAAKDIGRNLDFIRGFESVTLCFDMDDPGRKAEEEVARLLPSVYIARYPEKDANEMMMKGKSRQLVQAVLFGAKKHRPNAVVSVDDIWERATKPIETGLSWPWPSVTKLTYGIRKKMIYGLGAGVGIGKTEFFHEIQAHLISVHKQQIGLFMFEENCGRTLKALAEKMFNKPFTQPDGLYTQAELEEGINSLKDKVLLYDTRVGKDWDEIKSAIRYMVAGENIRYIFLDHLTALTAQVSSAEANDLLNRILSDISELVNELDCSIFYCSHLNPPASGEPHERGGKVVEAQMTGSRAAAKWSNYIFGLERNKDPSLPEEERNLSTLVLLKDREAGNVGEVRLYFNKYTRQMREPEMR